MRLAFVITAHKYPEQLIRLVSRLYEPDRGFFVHVDKKTSPEVFESIVHGLNRFSKDGIIENPAKCRLNESKLLCSGTETDQCLTTTDLTCCDGRRYQEASAAVNAALQNGMQSIRLIHSSM